MKVGTDGVLLGAWVEAQASPKRILDIGTGTGLLALMMAQKFPTAKIDAVEIDHQAFLQASENFAASKWAGRLKIYPSPIQKFTQIVPYKYDLILSNPPYFHNSHKAKSTPRTQARHNDTLPSNELLEAVCQVLDSKGSFHLILPPIEGLQFRQLASEYGLYCQRMMHFKPTPSKATKRILLQLSRLEVKKTLEVKELIGRGTNHQHTPAYCHLTKGFYLNKCHKKPNTDPKSGHKKYKTTPLP